MEIPDGWVLEVRPRRNSSTKIADKYYHEPYTGRQFRSLPSIRRYLHHPTRNPPKLNQEPTFSFGTLRSTVYNGKMEDLEEAGRQTKHVASVQDAPSSILPDGWIVEKVPRSCGFKTDRYFIEPVTGKRFRSVSEVQRYLTAVDEFPTKYKPLKLINASAVRSSETPPPLPVLVNPDNFDIFNPPDNITWILTSNNSNNSCSSGNDNWIAFSESFRVPDYVKEMWEETFLTSMTQMDQEVDSSAFF